METVIKAEGMACGGCSANIEKALTSLDGVEEASADHRDGTVRVRHDRRVTEQDIRKAVSAAGYGPS